MRDFHTTEIYELWIIWRATNFGSLIFQKINLQGRNKLIVLSMSANEFTEVPLTIGCMVAVQVERFAVSRWMIVVVVCQVFQNSPICNDLLGTGKLFERNINFLVYELFSVKI